MQAMRSEMNNMVGEQRKQFELNGNSRWRTICGLMDRARETLVAARFASKSVIPSSWQKDKSGLGVTGFKFEPLLPKLQAKAEAEGIYWTDDRLEKLWGIPRRQKAKGPGLSDSDSNEESPQGEDDSDSSDASSSEEEEQAGANDAESNPYFVVDTEPTPVNHNGSTPKKSKEKRPKKEKSADPSSADPTPAKKSKKRSREDEVDELSSAKKSKTSAVDLSSVDFAAVEAQLHAEVEAGLKARQAEEKKQAGDDEEGKPKGGKAKLTRKEKRKRKRESDGIQAIIDSFKKKQRLEVGEKMPDATVSGEVNTKAEKKSKKRKAEKDGDEGRSKKLKADE
jgi:hypothetical protein